VTAPGNAEGELSFIHIPKNAGTSIKKAIVDHRLPIPIGDHSYPRKLSAREFVVLRDPIERFVSAFNYVKQYWANSVNGMFQDANELAVSASDPRHPLHATAWTELGNDPAHYLVRNGTAVQPHSVAGRITRFTWIYEPQTTWLINNPAHVLRFRHLARDFSDLLLLHGITSNVSLTNENTSGGSSRPMTTTAIDFLENLYAEDFRFIRSRTLDSR
jgi:hypothetical protein